MRARLARSVQQISKDNIRITQDTEYVLKLSSKFEFENLKIEVIELILNES
jgi:hypothetical protein